MQNQKITNLIYPIEGLNRLLKVDFKLKEKTERQSGVASAGQPAYLCINEDATRLSNDFKTSIFFLIKCKFYED